MSAPSASMPEPASEPVVLSELVAGTDAQVMGDSSITVSDLAYDSRCVRPGALFFAVRGEHHDGADFVAAAVDAGAVAAVTSRPVAEDRLAAEVLVTDPRRAMGPIAHRFFGDPTARLALAGITGTNGKTTTAYLVHHLLEGAGVAGLLGTVEYRLGDLTVTASRTTPESLDLAKALAVMVERGATAAAMEVSSHALDQGRAEGCRFDVVAFTNLSQDHLDYHETMEEYFEAKRSLFVDPTPGRLRVVNVDDEAGCRLVDDGLADITYGRAAAADLRFEMIDSRAAGVTLTLDGMGYDDATVTMPLVGAHNASNACCAVAICRALGLEAGLIAERLTTAPQVPGRLERIDAGQPFAVFVDYAHTPDGLANVIPAVRAVIRGRVITVFGCGGDRDRAKRPLMGEIAAKGSDMVYVTSDNPRSEDPADIIDDIVEGVERVAGAVSYVDPDRRGAIEAAFAEARPGDAVLVAGKGHEAGQQIGETIIPFDDRDVSRELLAVLTEARS